MYLAIAVTALMIVFGIVTLYPQLTTKSMTAERDKPFPGCIFHPVMQCCTWLPPYGYSGEAKWCQGKAGASRSKGYDMDAHLSEK